MTVGAIGAILGPNDEPKNDSRTLIRLGRSSAFVLQSERSDERLNLQEDDSRSLVSSEVLDDPAVFPDD